jgi:hypothetical protein
VNKLNAFQLRMAAILGMTALALLAAVGMYLQKKSDLDGYSQLDLLVPQKELQIFLEFKSGEPLAASEARLAIQRQGQKIQRVVLGPLGAAHINVNVAKRVNSLKYTLLTLRTVGGAVGIDLSNGQLLQTKGKYMEAVDGKEYFIGHVDTWEGNSRYRRNSQLHQQQLDYRHSLTATAPVQEREIRKAVQLAALSEGAWAEDTLVKVRLSDTDVWIGWVEKPDWGRHFEMRIEKLSGRLVLRDLWGD